MNDIKVVATSLALSLAVNGGAVYGVQRMAYHNAGQERLLKLAEQKKDRIEVTFVEAPPKTRSEVPRKNERMSPSDALNQGQQADPNSETSGIKQEGPADQLFQKRGSGGAEPAPQVAAVKPSQASQEVLKRQVMQTPESKEEAADQEQKARPEAAQTEKPAPTPTVEPQKNEDDAFLAPVPIAKPVPSAEKPAAEQKPKAPPKKNDAMNLSQEAKPWSDEKHSQAPVAPVLGLGGAPGNAKVDTQEMAKAPSVSAQFFGITSFETTGSGMGKYMKDLKEKVWLTWYPYLSFNYPMDQRSADVVLSVRLNKKGDVKAVRVLDSYGEPLFTTYCVEVIQKAGNFGALPEEITALLKDEELEIKFGFHYR